MRPDLPDPIASAPRLTFGRIPQFPSAHYEVNVDWEEQEHHIARMVRAYDLDLTPEFQREHVWTDAQRARYIEYVLRGGEVGRNLTFNCPGWQSGTSKGRLVIVDGKQRLEAVRRFLRGEIAVFDSNAGGGEDGVPRRPGGWRCSELGTLPLGLGFRWRICSLDTEEEVLDLYLNINAGGTPHTKEELEKVRAMKRALRAPASL